MRLAIMTDLACSASYGEASYFESEQQLGAPLDWYTDYEVLRPLLQRLMQYSDTILILGPGTSGLHEQLYDSGYRGITCVDFSSKVLQTWLQHSADTGRTGLKYQLADIVEGLPFEHYPYHVIIDKGTMDCILCRTSGQEDGAKALQVMWNNLKSSGVLIMFSHGAPVMRLPLLQQVAWESIQVKVIIPPETSTLSRNNDVTTIREHSEKVACPDDCSFIYICRKSY